MFIHPTHDGRHCGCGALTVADFKRECLGGPWPVRLTTYEKWMVKQNVKHAREHGLDPTLGVLRANGYDRVADAVKAEF